MSRAFADITFTPSVLAAQERYASREQNRRFELSPDQRNSITAMDAEFIRTRDSFYMASVGENAWPYVQHRGGPVGFVKILNERTLGYADYRGNRQYLSVGNINANERVCLFLMDYANRRRLKIWGRASIVHEGENPELFNQLNDQSLGIIAERAFIIHIEALEWNCSKYITPRFTQDEIREAVQPLVDEIEQLKTRLAYYEHGKQE
ncbi:pyridoxamine 5'-phosphate oxidase [Cellvibrio zantedeschiae]|uniref:Pyridoxamine 5'-phosphate oxidase n=1 Tax=Cellvibrio zantedeschiae TaxID=1237077 RepID=A0ABQ3B8E4_9GAMM|nr:pyridoxamine 5'-phosphate oxidase family protein [Cellvibrio zantedeschiae]GGY83235.1 pyridoxamine 5'-phosphate oxidase [Cellvibrio zantedeschiae]